MDLEHLEAEEHQQRGQAEGLDEAARSHRRAAEQLYALQEQLTRLEQSMTSSDLQAAQVELRRSQELVETERQRLDEERTKLIRENLELTARCEKALEKARPTQNVSWLKAMGKGLGAEALKIGAGVVTELALGRPRAADSWIDTRMGLAQEALTRHVTRLEKAQAHLIETRKLLEREMS
jgi:flagellin-specific chaperone FliS